MKWVVALLVVLVTLRLVIGMWRGRVQIRACCPPADQDLRLRER